MGVRCQYLVGVLFLSLCGMASTQSSAQVNNPVPPNEIRVTLLGTASGPRAFVDKAGISTLVEAGGERLLFDAGRGSVQRLVQAGFPMNAVTKLFLTHLHSDHVIGIPDLMLSPWAAAPERKVPLEIWGPDGTRDMMRHLEEAFAFDIHMRRDVDESFSPDGIKMVTHNIQPGKVYERNGVTVTAFLVSHGLVKPSYGYRVDYAGRSGISATAEVRLARRVRNASKCRKCAGSESFWKVARSDRHESPSCCPEVRTSRKESAAESSSVVSRPAARCPPMPVLPGTTGAR